MLDYLFKAFFNIKYLFIYKIKSKYLNTVNEIVFKFNNPELRLFLSPISFIKNFNPRRGRFFFYILKYYKSN